MKTDADKCHLLVCENNTVKIKIGNFGKTDSKSQKLLGFQFDHILSFDDHVSKNYVKSQE